MRLEDNMMPVLTGLVFAVVLGTTVQNSDDIMQAFGAAKETRAADDVFFVRAGTDAQLDVLANDTTQNATNEQIRILAHPNCGEVVPGADGIAYLNSETCDGPVNFTYCLGETESCTAAEVTMRLRPAPVSVADAYIPEKRALLPLSATSKTETSSRSVSGATEDKTAPLSAFVVSLAPQNKISAVQKSDFTRFMMNVSIEDLNKMPLEDGSQFNQLSISNVPLNAGRTARFLVDHSSDAAGWDVGSAKPLLDLDANAAPIEAAETHAETVDIEPISNTDIPLIRG